MQEYTSRRDNFYQTALSALNVLYSAKKVLTCVTYKINRMPVIEDSLFELKNEAPGYLLSTISQLGFFIQQLMHDLILKNALFESSTAAGKVIQLTLDVERYNAEGVIPKNTKESLFTAIKNSIADIKVAIPPLERQRNCHYQA